MASFIGLDDLQFLDLSRHIHNTYTHAHTHTHTHTHTQCTCMQKRNMKMALPGSLVSISQVSLVEPDPPFATLRGGSG